MNKVTWVIQTNLLNDLDKIETKISALYKLKRIGTDKLNRHENEIPYTPYLLRAGKYVLWAGVFIIGIVLWIDPEDYEDWVKRPAKVLQFSNSVL